MKKAHVMCGSQIPSRQQVNFLDWTAMDVELRRHSSDLYYLLGQDFMDLNSVTETFTTIIGEFLLEHGRQIDF